MIVVFMQFLSSSMYRSLPFWAMLSFQSSIFIAFLSCLGCSDAFVLPSRRLSSQRRLFAFGVSSTSTVVGPPLPINKAFPGLQQVHYNPDIYVIHNFLDEAACADMIDSARQLGNMSQSPVAYSGWTRDFADLFELAAKGPVVWTALLAAWWQLHDRASATPVELVVQALQNYVVLLVAATASLAAFTRSRAAGLQALRTSTSTTLADMTGGAKTFVERTAQLFDASSTASSTTASYFEAPTIIRYEAGQQLAPHFDANRSADLEDANRGGQTLATLLVYLNDVADGGKTRFGKLRGVHDDEALTIQPKRGDALLFFPADVTGRFDERTEHEGCPAVDEKWIARIWRHAGTVPPPFGLKDTELARLGK